MCNYINCHCRVQHPSKVSLEADYHQRLTARFTLTDKVTKKTMTAHQTFVRLTNVKTKQEVIFVAEEDGSDAYKFDLVSNWVLYFLTDRNRHKIKKFICSSLKGCFLKRYPISGKIVCHVEIYVWSVTWGSLPVVLTFFHIIIIITIY